MTAPELRDAAWRKSSRSSANSNCVEIAFPGNSAVAARDSKDPTGGVLVFSRVGWVAFTAACRGA